MAHASACRQLRRSDSELAVVYPQSKDVTAAAATVIADSGKASFAELELEMQDGLRFNPFAGLSL